MRERFELPMNSVMSNEELKTVFFKNVFDKKYKGAENKGLQEEMANMKVYEAVLTEEYNKGSKTGIRFTPSKVNAYFNCPFAFMVDNVFEIDGGSEEEDGYNILEVTMLYRNVLKDYYKNVQNNREFDEETLNKVFMSNAAGLRTLVIEQEEIKSILDSYLAFLKKFLILDLDRFRDYEEKTKKVLKPYIIGEYIMDKSSFSVPFGSTIDRVDLEYEQKGSELVPTGKFVVYSYKKGAPASLEDLLNRENCQLIINYY